MNNRLHCGLRQANTTLVFCIVIFVILIICDLPNWIKVTGVIVLWCVGSCAIQVRWTNIRLLKRRPLPENTKHT